MNQAEFARFHSVSKKTVTSWKNKGWVVLNADGLVDKDQSNKNLEQYRKDKIIPDSDLEVRVTQGSRVTDLGNAPEGNGNSFPDDSDAGDEVGLPAKELNRRLILEKLKVERERAKAAKFETDIREGKLLLADDVSRHDAEVGSRLKKKLLALPTELAVRVAAVSSPAEVESLLRAEITEALNEFLDAYGVHYS